MIKSVMLLAAACAVASIAAPTPADARAKFRMFSSASAATPKKPIAPAVNDRGARIMPTIGVGVPLRSASTAGAAGAAAAAYAAAPPSQPAPEPAQAAAAMPSATPKIETTPLFVSSTYPQRHLASRAAPPVRPVYCEVGRSGDCAPF